MKYDDVFDTIKPNMNITTSSWQYIAGFTNDIVPPILLPSQIPRMTLTLPSSNDQTPSLTTQITEGTPLAIEADTNHPGPPPIPQYEATYERTLLTIDPTFNRQQNQANQHGMRTRRL